MKTQFHYSKISVELEVDETGACTLAVLDWSSSRWFWGHQWFWGCPCHEQRVTVTGPMGSKGGKIEQMELRDVGQEM